MAMAMGDDDQLKTCVVIGGRSFIGRCLVMRLLKLGNWIVRVADSAQSLQLDPCESKYDSPLNRALSTARASYFHVDVRNKNTIVNAIEGSSVVFYTDDVDCNHDFYYGYSIIVQGAKNVINACRECKVKRLIYSSTAEVVFDKSYDIHNGNETLIYASKFTNVYNELKAQAEALVVLANDIDGLLTCALRPSNVFGPGDNQFLPSLVDVAKSEWAKFIIGSDESISDFTYVENVAHALICAEKALGSRMVIVSGKVFFITNLAPMKSWLFALRMLEGLGYYRPVVKLPRVVVQFMVFLIRWMHSNMNSRDLNSSVSVHNIVQLTSRTRTFNCSAAQQHIEYSPVVSLDEGVTLTVESFPRLANDCSSTIEDFDEHSKIEELLGNGEIAETLLWRDERKSFLSFFGVASLYFWFCVCERTVISSTATLLLLIIVALSGYAKLSPIIYGNARLSPKGSAFPISRISLSFYEISEMEMRSSLRTIANAWNGAGHIARSLVQGGDWGLFFKVVVSLYLFKLLVVNSFPTSIGIALSFSFILFFVYEQYEEEVDGLTGMFLEMVRQFTAFLTRHLQLPVTSPLCNNDIRPSVSKDQR